MCVFLPSSDDHHCVLYPLHCVEVFPMIFLTLDKISLFMTHTQIPCLDRGLDITIMWMLDSSFTRGGSVSCALFIMNQKQNAYRIFFVCWPQSILHVPSKRALRVHRFYFWFQVLAVDNSWKCSLDLKQGSCPLTALCSSGVQTPDKLTIFTVIWELRGVWSDTNNARH